MKQAKALRNLGVDLSKIGDVAINQAISELGVNGIGLTLLAIAEKKRERLNLLSQEDGAEKYQPLTKAYAQRGYLGPHTLKKLRQAKRGY